MQHALIPVYVKPLKGLYLYKNHTSSTPGPDASPRGSGGTVTDSFFDPNGHVCHRAKYKHEAVKQNVFFSFFFILMFNLGEINSREHSHVLSVALAWKPAEIR